MPQKYGLEERLLGFSVSIIKLVEHLPNTRTGNHVAGQLLRSGTFPYPTTVKPRQRSRQRILSINCHSLKELREAQRWLRFDQKGSSA